MRSFKVLSANKDTYIESDSAFFISEKSFDQNFEFVFGHNNELFKKRFCKLIFG